ncbi:MAG: tetratricopeptide repeat protein, partial [Thermoanaerobaculia bacterium]
AQSSLARVLHHLGRREEAQKLLTEVLNTRARLLGEEHVHVALTKKDLAAVHLSEGETEAAAKLLSQALAVLRESKSEGSWEIAEAESLWGAYLTAVGSFEDAESFLINSYRRLSKIRGSESIYTRDAYRRLTDHFAARGEPLPASL